MSDLLNLTIRGALEGLQSKEFSAVELTSAYIARSEDQAKLNAYITFTPDHALAQAKASDARYASGDSKALDGIPLGIKDVFCTKDIQTTAASKILEGFVPPYESTVTQNLFDDGAVMLGKLNMDEFAMGSGNTNSAFGSVINPWRAQDDDRDLVPGGSSGGSSAAVAAHMVLGATGTDTGGSIRQPAAYCGISGIKPTYGRCSRFGMVAFASSLDQAGPMARTVEDCAILLGSMAGHDPKDSTSANRPVPDYAAALSGDLKGVRVGIPKEYDVEGTPDAIRALWEQGKEWLKSAGATIVDVSLPHTQYALPTYYIIAPAEASSNLARYDGVRYGLRESQDDLTDQYEITRGKGFGDEVKRRILIGTHALSSGYYDAYYVKAQRVRRKILEDFETAYQSCDVLLTPTTPTSAFAIGENQDDPVKMYLNDLFTIPASLAGLPGMSIPAGFGARGLPLGLQVIGKAWDEETVLNVSLAIEQAAQFSFLKP